MATHSRITLSLGKVSSAVRSFKEENADTDTEYVDECVSRANDAGKAVVTLELDRVPAQLVRHMMDTLFLTPKQTQALAVFACGGDKAQLFSISIAEPKTLHNVMTGITQRAGADGLPVPNAEWRINNRWYPIYINSNYHSDEFRGGVTNLHACVKIADQQESVNFYISESFFVNENGDRITMTLEGVFERLGLRVFQTDMREYIKKLTVTDRLAQQVGKAVDITNNVIIYHSNTWWKQLESMEYGSPIAPRMAVIEPEFEIDRDGRNYGFRENQAIPLPFVRVFALDLKRYVYAAIEDVEEHAFDENAIDRLVLPPAMHMMLTTIFRADTQKFFGDLVRGKHGGMVMLAHGPSGVGKTLTAEVFAEHTKRPLYVMEMGELGTTLKDVELNLQRVFDRASRWNAVLLFDEADVFLAKRDDNIDRSAIVGVFLRLTDYYRGLLFMTTNRADVIDDAFKSRITLRLDYPQLDREARKRIWATMLALARVTIDDIDGIPDVELNGRQIRSLVRLIRIIHPDGKVTAQQVKEVCQYACR